MPCDKCGMQTDQVPGTTFNYRRCLECRNKYGPPPQKPYFPPGASMFGDFKIEKKPEKSLVEPPVSVCGLDLGHIEACLREIKSKLSDQEDLMTEITAHCDNERAIDYMREERETIAKERTRAEKRGYNIANHFDIYCEEDEKWDRGCCDISKSLVIEDPEFWYIPEETSAQLFDSPEFSVKKISKYIDLLVGKKVCYRNRVRVPMCGKSVSCISIKKNQEIILRLSD